MIDPFQLHIMICGSRNNINRDLVRADLYSIISRYKNAIFHLGGAGGVDLIAEEYCESLGVKYILHYPDYNRYGRPAPLVRNDEMINCSDRVFAFWNGESSGTKYVINKCLENDVPLVVFYEGKEHA